MSQLALRFAIGFTVHTWLCLSQFALQVTIDAAELRGINAEPSKPQAKAKKWGPVVALMGGSA